ncbi:helix-turn-helix domain-containing protein [Nonomuraea sp. NPDC003560]|uniref:helix-turn-helix domain-containing protein n=1 Tax=Nonomuraea sp. NPDC003560 TaxID=3364341 RepID=UPI00368052DE
MDTTVTTREIAQARRVSVRTVQRWAAKGKLDAVKVGGRWIITLSVNLDQYKPFQLDKARELIEQGGIVATSRPALYVAISSDGTSQYVVDQAEHSCTCRAAIRGLNCYHLAAADLVEAA